jgi:hypothetical protein
LQYHAAGSQSKLKRLNARVKASLEVPVHSAGATALPGRQQGPTPLL